MKLFLKSIFFSVGSLSWKSLVADWGRESRGLGGPRVPVADKTPWHDVDESNLLATVETCSFLLSTLTVLFVRQFICSSPHRWDLRHLRIPVDDLIVRVTWRVMMVSRDVSAPYCVQVESVSHKVVIWFICVHFGSICWVHVLRYLPCLSDVKLISSTFVFLLWWRNACSIVLSLSSDTKRRVVIVHVAFHSFFKKKLLKEFKLKSRGLIGNTNV